ncbi:MAG: DUF2807 domain-containing protein [Bacteroidales bacterium]|nr:DUF2807 domain-containing protein [Bacteroidales bacterium]
MKTKATTILLFLFSLSLIFNSCKKDEKKISPSGNITKQEFSFTDYNIIDIENAFEVNLTFSENEEKIEIRANENLHQYINVGKNSNTLLISFQDNVEIDGNATLIANITTKEVSEYYATGAVSIILQNKLIADDVRIELIGACYFGGKMEVNQVDALLIGATEIEISGSTNSFYVIAEGASSIKNYDFIVKYLNLNLSGASNTYLTITEEMDIIASGASILYYKGDGVIKSQILTGASQIIKMD